MTLERTRSPQRVTLSPAAGHYALPANATLLKQENCPPSGAAQVYGDE